MSVYLTALKPGDTILGMDLSHGGHLTHGHPLSFSGREYKVVAYGVRREDERIDYDALAALAREHRPKLIIAGASAYAREIDFARFGAVADEVGAALMCDIAHIAGLVIAGLHVSPGAARARSSRRRRTRRCAARAAASCSAAAAHAKDLDRSVFPGVQGGPLEHVIAAKAVAFAEAAHARVRRLPAARSSRTRRRSRRRSRSAASASSPAAPTTTSCWWTSARRGISGKDAEKPLEKRRAHRQQEHDSLRHALADGRLGHPHRHSRRDDARAWASAEMETIGDAIARALEAPGRRRRPRPESGARSRSSAPPSRSCDAARGGGRRGRPAARARAREPAAGGAPAARPYPGRASRRRSSRCAASADRARRSTGGTSRSSRTRGAALPRGDGGVAIVRRARGRARTSTSRTTSSRRCRCFFGAAGRAAARLGRRGVRAAASGGRRRARAVPGGRTARGAAP